MASPFLQRFPLVPLLRQLSKGDIINFILTCKAHSEILHDRADIWRALIAIDFGATSRYKDPRQEYLDRKQYITIGKTHGSLLLPNLKSYTGECWYYNTNLDYYKKNNP